MPSRQLILMILIQNTVVLIADSMRIIYTQSDLLDPDFTASKHMCGGWSMWEDLFDFYDFGKDFRIAL